MDVKVVGMEAALAMLDRVAYRDIPFALAKALNDTAKDVRDAETEEIARVFERPTPFIRNSLYIWPATKARQSVEIGFKTRQASIMRPHILGGDRIWKRSERWLQSFYTPGQKARLNQYGNMSPAQVTQILSALKRLPDKYQNITARSRSKNRKPRDYFMLRAKKGSLIPGVYEKYGPFGIRVRPVMIFIKSPQYRKRMSFFEIGKRIANLKLWPNFHRAMQWAAMNPHGG